MSVDKPAQRWERWERHKGLNGVVIAVLYLVGIAHWIFFFTDTDGGGLAGSTSVDWKLASNYHAVLRDAFHHFQLPLLMDFTHYSDRFLGLPETPLSPQFILLAFMDDPLFNLCNVLILHTFLFLGLLLIRRELNLSPIPFIFLCLLYEYNGYLVARVSAGHFMWFGYFFMPYVHWSVIRMLRKPDDERNRILLAGFFFVIMLQGSFHIFVWWIIFFCIMVILQPKLFRPVFYVLVLAMGLNLFRFLPSAVSLHDTELHYLSGYQSFGWLLEGLTVIQRVDWLDDGTHSGIRWWELDVYVGIAGLVLLAYFGIVRLLSFQSNKALRILDYASLCMMVLCFIGVLGAVAKLLPIPLFTSQRVGTRLIVVPLTTCIVLGALGMEDMLRARKRNLPVRLGLLFLLGLVAYDLCRHSLTWQVARLAAVFGGNTGYIDTAHLILEPDMNLPGMRLYVIALVAGVVASIGFFALAVYRYRRAGEVCKAAESEKI